MRVCARARTCVYVHVMHVCVCVCVHMCICVCDKYIISQEPDTPDIIAITATTPTHPLSSHDDDNTLVPDLEEESVVSESRRRCYHPSITSANHSYISQMDNISSKSSIDNCV